MSSEVVQVTWNNAAKLLKIRPPDSDERLPHDIIVVMDNSASMDGSVSIKDENNSYYG